jgi:membrane-bound lytic murein transglycosylase B
MGTVALYRTQEEKMVGRRLFVLALLVAGLAAPKAVQAQAAPTPAAARPAAPAAADPKLEAFARLHFTLNLARDEYNAALAKAHEPGSKLEAMDAFDKKIVEILTAAGTTREAYYQELYVVSSDVAAREVFDRLMRELAAQ